MLNEIIPDKLFQAREKGKVCSCYSVAGGVETFLYGFTPDPKKEERAGTLAANRGCSKRACWYKYQQTASYVKKRELAMMNPPINMAKEPGKLFIGLKLNPT